MCSCSRIFFFFLRLARFCFFFFFSSRRRHTRCGRDWSSDVRSSDLGDGSGAAGGDPGPSAPEAPRASLRTRADRARGQRTRRASGIQRRASARTERNNPIRMTERKKPTSDRNTEPRAKGLKWASKERLTDRVSKGSGRRYPSESIIHSRKKRPRETTAATI